MNKCCLNNTTATVTKSSNGQTCAQSYSNGAPARTIRMPDTPTTISNNKICQCNVHGMSEDNLTHEVRDAIAIRMQTTFEFFRTVLQKYNTQELMFSFNGGKDCTILLDMLIRFCEENQLSHRHIPLLYIQSDDAFPEMDEFVEDCVRHYGVKLIKYKGSLKEALQRMCDDMPRIKAVFLGTRNTDPYCGNLASMQPTDNGWPQLMRLNPILEWTYHDVWHYIRIYKVPYCKLYDQGYTSLGHRSNTLPNPYLRRSDIAASGSNGQTDSYRPAYELSDSTLERAGRK